MLTLTLEFVLVFSLFTLFYRKNMCGVPYMETHEFNFDRAYSDDNTNTEVKNFSDCILEV
jgi:hypothetical protein